MISRPLFVFGAARSGTSFFSRLLRDHLDYGFGPEAKFLVDLGRRYAHSGNLQHDRDLQTLVDQLLDTEMVQIVNTRYSQHFQRDMRIARDDVLKHVSERRYPQVVLALFAAIGERMGKPLVGNKYPDYWKHLPLLLKWYPEARFIHLLRDGRDVALSTMHMNWGAHTVYASACEWRRTVKTVAAFEQRVGPDQTLNLRYEDLLQSPQMTLTRLCDFLDIEPSSTRRRAFVDEILRNPDRSRYQRWKSQMTPREQRLFEGIAGPELLRSGYPINIRQNRIRWFEHLYYQAEDTGRRGWQKAHNLLAFT